MKKTLIVDMESFLWSFIELKNTLSKYDAIIFLCKKNEISEFCNINSILKLVANSDKEIKSEFLYIDLMVNTSNVYSQLCDIANKICDDHNPDYHIFHLMCWQLPQFILEKTLDENCFVFTKLKANPVFIPIRNNEEASLFLKNCQEKGFYFFPIQDYEISKYNPNEIIQKQIEQDNLINVDLLSMSVFDFIKSELSLFKIW